MKEKLKPRIRILLLSTGLIFLLLVLTMVISNIVVMIAVHAGLLSGRPETPLLPFLVQTGVISIVTGTILFLLFSRLFIQPLGLLIQAIHDVAAGNFHTKIHLKHPKEFRRLSESFNQMTEELAGTETLRSDFINNFSHEFRTPIMSVLGFARLLKKGNLDPAEELEYLDIMIRECLRLCDLSTNVLNLSKVETLSLLTDTELFNAGEQIRESILMLEQKWNRKNISFDLAIQDVPVTANPSLLRQIWINLIDNAVKFSPESGLISISACRKDGHFIFSITDRGSGMSPSVQEKIFDKFYQGDPSHATEGNGLGLPLVRKAVELHRGTIDVKSTAGKGSTFIVMLPSV